MWVMKMTRQALAVILSILVAEASFPQYALAQVIGNSGSAAGISGVSGVVPKIELNGGFSALSPAPSLLAPSLLGGVPVLSAPSILTPLVVNPISAIPVLPISALSGVPAAARALAVNAPVDAAKIPFNAQSQLTLTGEKLTAAAAKGSDQSGILDTFFTGAKEIASTLTGETAAGFPAALAPQLSAPSIGDGKAVAPTPITLEAMAIDPAKSIAVRQDAVAQLAKTDGSKESLQRVADANPQGGAADYEIHRSALKALAEQGVVKSLRAVSEAHKEELLARLVSDKPSSAVFDYDDTLEKFREPISPAVAAGLQASNDAGVKTAILTDRPDAKKNDKDVTVLDSIASMTPAQKAKLTVGSNSGARLSTFDSEGKQVVAFDAALKFTEAQAAAITAASAKTADKFGRFEYNGAEENLSAFKWVRFLPLGMPAETVQAAAEFMQAELDAAGAGVTVSGRQAADAKNPSYLTISLLDKTVGIQALREKAGFGGPMLLVGDSFFGTRMVDADMTKAAGAGSLTLAVGGLADPRIDNVFVWPTKGAEASAEILGALGTAKPAAPKGALRRLGDKLLNLIGWNAPVVKAPGADDPINWKTFLGLVIPRIPSMGAYMLVTIAFVAIAVPVVGWTGYGVMMSLSPMAGIAASKIMGKAVKNMSARNAMALNTLLRVGSLMLLPTFWFFGVVNVGTILLGALAEGWLLSSMMMTEGSFIKVLFPAKQLGNINGALFQMFPAVQVILGLFLGIGHFADMINPFMVFAGAAAINLLVVLPIVWKMIPNVMLSDAPAAAKAALVPFKTKALAFLKDNAKPLLALAVAIGLFAAMTFWAPIATLPFLVAHAGLKTSLPITAALVYWISRSAAFKGLVKGRTSEASAEEKALVEKRGTLASEIADLRRGGADIASVGAKEDELAAVSSELATHQGRQWKSIKMMALGTAMYYPLYLIAAPHVAEILAGPQHKGAMIGQFLGALFFGSWISTAARTKFPDIKIPFTGGKKTIGAHRLVQALVAALAGAWVFTKIVPGSALAAAAAVAIVAGLMALSARITDKGWIKFAGLGFATVWLPFVVWMWPLAIPFLTVQTAMFISLIAAGLFNGPSFVSLIIYLQRNTARSESSEVTGIQGSLFNASISAAYALITIISGFLNPAYPMVLAAIGLINVLIGMKFWNADKSLPGLPKTFFTPKAPKK